MREDPRAITRTPRRFHPRGLPILYEDHDIIVVNKRCGLLTMSTGNLRENTAYRILNDYVRKGNQKSRNRVFIVHRLDKDTSGVIVVARSEEAQRFLQDAWPTFTKTYSAVVHGILPAKAGVITSYLAENSIHRMYSVRDPAKGKLATTEYRVVRESRGCSLLEIRLLTGRKNQIRVHFSERGFPVAGDTMYGGGQRSCARLALHAAVLTIVHPHTRHEMSFTAEIPAFFSSLVPG